MGEWQKDMIKKILLANCLFFAAASVCAGDSWISDEKTGCQIKNPLPLPNESITWAGECKDGKASGPGTLRWYADGKLFLTLEGVMEEGQCRHDCSVTTKGGSKYIGELQDNRPHGSGSMTYSDGTKYSGSWARGKKHGKGTFIAKDGSSHEELWENGKQYSDAKH